jgi:hypothetical protein
MNQNEAIRRPMSSQLNSQLILLHRFTTSGLIRQQLLLELRYSQWLLGVNNSLRAIKTFTIVQISGDPASVFVKDVTNQAV